MSAMKITNSRSAWRCIKSAALSLCILSSSFASEPLASAGAIEKFAQSASVETGYDPKDIVDLLDRAMFRPDIIGLINKPAENMPWFIYKSKVVTPARIESGRKFLEVYNSELSLAEERYRVPREIIAAIIGIESGFGANKGGIPVMDSLGTLAFNYPRREKFFKSELVAFLKLSRENGVDPSSVLGSYAGAMGWPQFMPSSSRRLAIDFDGDGKIDLINSPADSIGSVANYLSRSGWVLGGPAVRRVNKWDKNAFQLIGDDGIELFYVPTKNFNAILSYNRSRHYAMAVISLGAGIKLGQPN